jgi:hypothetical protein
MGFGFPTSRADWNAHLDCKGASAPIRERTHWLGG